MRITLCGDTPLVFNLADVRLLRDHGVVGVLSGTLPTLSQQNVFASVPLRLAPEEALWLLHDSPLDATLVAAGPPWFAQDARSALSHSTASSEATQRSLAAQRGQRRAQHAEKLQKLGLAAEGAAAAAAAESALDAGLLLETPNCAAAGAAAAAPAAAGTLGCPAPHYALYRALRRRGLVVAPGGRFGGKYVVYPGDPLRFHSHVVVSEPLAPDAPLDFLHVVAEARLATTVKKTWVASSVDRDTVRFYSVEWAGFG